MKSGTIFLFAIAAGIMIGNSSFSCISYRKLSADSIRYLKPTDFDAYGLRPRIDLTDLKTDSLRLLLPDGSHLFTKQGFRDKIAFVANKANKIYEITYFEIVTAGQDSVNTTLYFHTYNAKHSSLSGKNYTQTGIMLPIAYINSFTKFGK